MMLLVVVVVMVTVMVLEAGVIEQMFVMAMVVVI